jgi:hypothetical protein
MMNDEDVIFNTNKRQKLDPPSAEPFIKIITDEKLIVAKPVVVVKEDTTFNAALAAI